VTADEGLLRHFRAEYGAPDATRPVRVSVSIDNRLPDDAVVDLQGGHKTTSWSVSLGRADADPLRAVLALRGRPRWFGVSLIQGFIVEPLISVAAAIGGHALLPAAAIAEEGGALLLIGRSRSGKSSLSARALALGRQVLGDDQVLIDAGGLITPFPRRMRVYDDLLETSPMAVRSLPPRVRLDLRLRRVVRLATRGFVAPSLAIPRNAFGDVQEAVAMPVHRIVVVRRSTSAQELSMEPISREDVRSEAMEILGEQRRRLSRTQRDDWLTLLQSVSEREAATLRAALHAAPTHLVSVPEAWGAPWAVDALARALEIT
jgi:hypothetical protein